MTDRRELLAYVETYKRESCRALLTLPSDDIAAFVELVLDTYARGARLLACANGGGCGFVANLVADLNLHAFAADDKTQPGRRPTAFEALDLCASPATLTALMNDRGPAFIYSAQVAIHGRPGDTLVAFSGSGNSPNVIEALTVARARGMRTALMTRNRATKGAALADVLLVSSDESVFPGQTGGNAGNFAAEDLWSKVSHIACGILKRAAGNAP